MKVLKYTGTAHHRTIRPQDLDPMGFDYPDVLFFDTQDLVTRGQAQVINDEVADWLVEHDTFVVVEDDDIAPKLRQKQSADAPVEPDKKSNK